MSGNFPLALAARGLMTPPFAMPRLLTDAASRAPELTWLTGPEGSLAYGSGLSAARAGSAELVARGVIPGDRVAICLPNGADCIIALHAAWLAGAIPALLHPAYAQDLQAKQIAVVEPALLVGGGARAETLAAVTGTALLPPDFHRRGGTGFPPPERPVPDLDLDDVALLQFTGGTTGDPKAAMLTHRNLSFGVGQIASVLSGLEAEREVTLAIAPFSHITGLNGVLGLMTYLRGTIVLPPPTPAELAETCARHRVSYLAGPPTMLNALAAAATAAPGERAPLRYVIAGGAPLPGEVAARFEASTGAAVLDGYGLSETAPAVSLAGRPVPETRVTVRDPDSGDVLPHDSVGELCVLGPQVMPGYWNNPAASAEAFSDGWLRTGDIGSVAADGTIAIIDRLKDIIIASGYNVYPARVEEAVCRHPAVAEVAAFGVPDPYRGETVAVAVSLRPGHQLDLTTLVNFLATALSPMEMPKRLHVLDDLPRSPAGKILRRSIREGMEKIDKEQAAHGGTREN